MEYVRYQLAAINIPHNVPVAALFNEVCADLIEQIEGTDNLGSASIGVVDGALWIPVESDRRIALGDGLSFRASIRQEGQLLIVESTGHDSKGNITRTVRLSYGIAQRASSIFSFGVASKSAISMNGNVAIRGTAGNEAHGSVLTTTSDPTPLTMIGNSRISGDLSMTNPNLSSISVGSNSRIAGYTPGDPNFANHVHAGIEPPEFPVVDTTAFIPYLQSTVNTGNPSGTYFKNVRVKAGTNPTFNNNTVIEGVMYIEYPNQVRFSGKATIRGTVVVQTNSNFNEDLNPADNTLTFSGAVTAHPMSSLPPSSDFPPELRAMSGAFVLAPGFSTRFGGNFGTVGGSIVASQIRFHGTAGGTVKGSVINLKDTSLELSGTTDIIIESQGTAQYPPGVFFGSNFAPLPDTWEELR
jgi:hypothetical protein